MPTRCSTCPTSTKSRACPTATSAFTKARTSTAGRCGSSQVWMRRATRSGTWIRTSTDGAGNVVGVEKVTTGDATEATQYLLEKSALPDFTGGLNTTLRWKSLDLTIMTNFQFGGYGYDYDFSAFSSANFPMNRLKNYADAWNPETGKVRRRSGTRTTRTSTLRRIVS